MRPSTYPRGTPEVLSALAELLGVPPADLEAFLRPRWGVGEAERAARRMQALRDEYANRAAAARRLQAKRPQSDVRAVIDQKLADNPRWSKKRAFDWLAAERRIAPETVRNAYYSPHDRGAVITLSRIA